MNVIWISVAILSAAILGLVNIFDSHLVSKRMPSIRSYLLIVSPIIMLSAIIIAFIFPLPTILNFWYLTVAVISGFIRAVSVIILLYTLRREEVSRAVPVVFIYPVFVAILAVPLLGETLNYLQGLAIAIIVVGVVIISIKKRTVASKNWLGKTFFLLLSSSLLLAFADVTSKYALEYFSSWNMYWISILCIAATLLVISLRLSVINELTQIIRPHSALMLVAVNEMLVVASAIMMFWAMERGTVSLVSTLASTRPVFVVIYALILSRFLPNLLLERDLSRGVIIMRLVATVMIAGGIAIIYLV